jgi:hypothetical protein
VQVVGAHLVGLGQRALTDARHLQDLAGAAGFNFIRLLYYCILRCTNLHNPTDCVFISMCKYFKVSFRPFYRYPSKQLVQNDKKLQACKWYKLQIGS